MRLFKWHKRNMIFLKSFAHFYSDILDEAGEQEQLLHFCLCISIYI